MSFAEKLTTTVRSNNSLLCVGLDPDLDRIPASFLPAADHAERLRAFCFDIVERTSDLVCAYKPNAAFFEQGGPDGMAAMRDVITAIPDSIPVLLDAKRGDIGNTAKAYARAAYEVWGADAITVSPYLGQDSVAPFLAYDGKCVFLLCHTSNASAYDVQHHGTPPLYHRIATMGQAWGSVQQIGFVVGATHIDALMAVRSLAPRHWLLAPGVGAQGGDLAEAVRAGLDDRGQGLIVPVSRGVLYADDPRAAAQALRQHINDCRPADASRRALVLALFEAGCVRFGDFTLASGKSSPIYIDLRRVISFPALFHHIVEAYSRRLSQLGYDRIAAVPYAAVPAAAAVAMQLGQPMVYPRKEAKGHGTGKMVEGVFTPGQTAVVIEDVITSGGSLLAALATLQGEGLRTKDVVVLVDREQGGGERLAEEGIKLHAVLRLTDILDVLHDAGRIDTATYRGVLNRLVP